MYSEVIGWDIGGANLKAVLIDGNGRLQQVLQVPCELWRGLNELEAAIDIVLNTFTTKTVLHAVTMTGELVDLFADRRAGVKSISYLMDCKLSGIKQFYTGALQDNFSGFVAIDGVDSNWQYIASANWMASASFIASRLKNQKKLQHGLLIDIGSTTSDFVLFEDHKPKCIGFNDASRMQSEELVYTGIIRTPLMALGQNVKFNNCMTSVAAEYFSTTADVYRLTGQLQPIDDLVETADNREKTLYASARRIARMVGHDINDADIKVWIELAHEFKRLQFLRLKNAALMHISRLKNTRHVNNISIIGAGVGSFLADEISKAIDIQYLDIAELINTDLHNPLDITHWAGVCLPAYAVAFLAFNRY